MIMMQTERTQFTVQKTVQKNTSVKNFLHHLLNGSYALFNDKDVGKNATTKTCHISSGVFLETEISILNKILNETI